MTRISYVDENKLSGEARAMVMEYAPYVTNIRRVVGHAQKLGPLYIQLGQKFMSGSAFDPRLRQLGILLACQLTGCEYEWRLHIPNSKRVGVPDEQISLIESGGWRESASFNEREKLVLEFISNYYAKPSIEAEMLERLKSSFSEEEILEMFIGFGFIFSLIKIMLSVDLDIDEFAGKKYIRKDEAGST